MFAKTSKDPNPKRKPKEFKVGDKVIKIWDYFRDRHNPNLKSWNLWWLNLGMDKDGIGYQLKVLNRAYINNENNKIMSIEKQNK